MPRLRAHLRPYFTKEKLVGPYFTRANLIAVLVTAAMLIIFYASERG